MLGQRVGEMRQIEREHFDEQMRFLNIPSKTAKNKSHHIVPLPPSAFKLISQAAKRSYPSEYLFPSPVTGKPVEAKAPSRAWRRVRGNVNLTDVCVHDMRRTVVTGMVRANVLREIASRAVNHVGGSNTVTDRVYNQHNYNDEKRDALSRWENHLMEVVKLT